MIIRSLSSEQNCFNRRATIAEPLKCGFKNYSEYKSFRTSSTYKMKSQNTPKFYTSYRFRMGYKDPKKNQKNKRTMTISFDEGVSMLSPNALLRRNSFKEENSNQATITRKTINSYFEPGNHVIQYENPEKLKKL